MDGEKVIKGLECCYASFPKLKGCPVCPYVKICYHDKACDELLHDALSLLKEQKVKTGYWIDSAGNDKCSICGEEYSDLYPDYGNTHFCPNCGAKMEGR